MNRFHRPVSVFGVPTDIGASRRGASMGPEALRVAGFVEAIAARGVDVQDLGDVAGPRNPVSGPVDGYRHLDEVAAWNRAVFDASERVLAAGRMPIMLGGDHCLAIGSIAAVAAHCRQAGRKLRVLWLDAHADFNTREITPSGNIHGMPVACLLGKGPEELTAIGYPGAKLDASRVVQIGLRDLDEVERRDLRDSGIHAFTMEDIDRRGMATIVEQAVEIVMHGTDHVHVSFDVDSVDPQVAPGTGTRKIGGLTYREAHLAMEIIAESGRLKSMEMVEVNPILDMQNQTAELAVGLIASALGKKIL